MQSRFIIQTIAFTATWFALTTGVLAAAGDEPGAPPPTERPKPKITISKETTYLTEPLRPDGYPDYVAALNQRMSEGVTPDNNAAVLLMKAFGPRDIPEQFRTK